MTHRKALFSAMGMVAYVVTSVGFFGYSLSGDMHEWALYVAIGMGVLPFGFLWYSAFRSMS